MNPVFYLLELGTRAQQCYCIRWSDDGQGISMIVLNGKKMEPGG